VKQTHADDLGSHPGGIPILLRLGADHAGLLADHAGEIPTPARPVADHADESGAIARDTQRTST
jgi:hypothetical protein